MKKVANKFFPVSIDLNNKNVLIIGAGKIALRKIETLLNYNCNIIVITKDILEERFLELEKNNKIKIFKNQEFEEKFSVLDFKESSRFSTLSTSTKKIVKSEPIEFKQMSTEYFSARLSILLTK